MPNKKRARPPRPFYFPPALRSVNSHFGRFTQKSLSYREQTGVSVLPIESLRARNKESRITPIKSVIFF